MVMDAPLSLMSSCEKERTQLRLSLAIMSGRRTPESLSVSEVQLLSVSSPAVQPSYRNAVLAAAEEVVFNQVWIGGPVG